MFLCVIFHCTFRIGSFFSNSFAGVRLLVSHLGWWTIYVHFDHFVFLSWFVLASAGFACPYAHSVCCSCSWSLPLSLKLLCLWIATLPLARVFCHLLLQFIVF
jgi:hypothetical protein